MKRATVRDLRYDFPKVERMLAEGEAVEITKRNQVIGTLQPPDKAIEYPDFMGRMKEIYGARTMKISWADFLKERKGRY